MDAMIASSIMTKAIFGTIKVFIHVAIRKNNSTTSTSPVDDEDGNQKIEQ